MSTIAPALATVPLDALPLRRITVDEYERIADGLDDAERVELIDGYMVRKMPKSPGFCYSTVKVCDGLQGLVAPGWLVRKEGTVCIPAYDEPEPDVSVVRGSIEDYRHRHPGPAEVGLLAETSLTTLDIDRGQKLLAYATAGIPTYWIVNLLDHRVEVYTGPGPKGYQARTDYATGQSVPVVIDGQHLGDIVVVDILP